jgi:uncharacterized protein YbjT (DUF2867 family)
MKALVTGATGFTGSHVVPLLLQRGVKVTCFVRETSDLAFLPLDRVDLAYGDLNDISSLQRALEGHDWLVNIASLGFGHAPGIVAAARSAGVQRAVFVSTTAIFTTLPASSKVIRMAAEAAIEDSGLPYTIIRPTMIFGTARDRNISRLINYLCRWPVLPVLGNGQSLQQPVHVEDVATAIVAALDAEAAVQQTYNIAGKSVVSYNHLVDTTARLLGRHVRRVHLPPAPVVAVLRLMERASLPVPLQAEQVLRLNEDKIFDYSAAADALDYHPMSLEEGLYREIAAMDLLPL